MIRFEDFQIDPEQRTLRRGGDPVHLQPRLYDLLLYIIRHRSRVVTREELATHVWENHSFQEHALHQALRRLRHVLGDDARRPRIIRTRRGVGVRFIADADEEETFQGLLERERELESIAAAWDDPDRGMVAIVGAAGSGKTALASAAIEMAGRGSLVVEGANLASPGAPPFSGWSQVFLELANACREYGFESGTMAEVRTLGRVVPKLASVWPDRQERAPLRLGAEWDRCFDAAATLLHKLGQRRRLVVLLEDLHWADAKSLELLRHLTEATDRRSVNFVVTCRSEAFAGSGPAAEMLGGLREASHVEWIEVAGLSRAAVGELLHRCSEKAPTRAVVSRIHARTLGNPLYVQQCTPLVPGDEASDPIDWLPDSVVRVAAHRIRLLSDASQNVLECAALLVHEIKPEILQDALGMPLETIAAALAEAKAAGFLREEGGDVRFEHGLLREALVSSLSPVLRADLHRRLAEASRRLQDGDAERGLRTLTHHLVEARPFSDAVETLRCSVRCGVLSMKELHHHDASAHFERALSLLRELGSSHPELEIDLLLASGHAHRAHGGRWQARQRYREALSRARRLGDLGRTARSAIEYATEPDWRPDLELVSELEKILDGTPDLAPELRARIAARLASWHAFFPERSDRVEVLMHGVAAECRRSREAILRAEESLVRCRIERIKDSMPPQARFSTAQEALSWARDVGDAELVVSAAFARVPPLLSQGRFAEADRCVAEVRQLAERHGLETHDVEYGLYAGLRHGLQGRFADAEAAYLQALALATQTREEVSPSSSPPFIPLAGMSIVLFKTLRLAEVAGPVASLYQSHETWLAPLGAGMAMIALDQGAPDRAQALLTELTGIDCERIRGRDSWASAAAILAWVAEELGDVEAAAALGRLLSSSASTWAVAGSAVFCTGPVSLGLAMCHEARGEWEKALAALEIAQAEADKAACLPFIAHAFARRARVHSRLGHREKARTFRFRAKRIAGELGMARLLKLLDSPH